MNLEHNSLGGQRGAEVATQTNPSIMQSSTICGNMYDAYELALLANGKEVASDVLWAHAEARSA